MSRSRSLYHRVVLTVTVMSTTALCLILYIFSSMLDDRTRLQPKSMDAHNAFLFISIGLLALLYIFVYLYIRRLFRPMIDLKKGVESVSKGIFDVQIPVKTKDDFGQLSESFNKMANEIQSMVKYKDQLLSDVSHELRTPITRMRLAAEMMDDGKQKDSMISDLREMSDLVENLLESNRLNYGVQSLNKQTFDLKNLIEDLIGKFPPIDPGIEFEANGNLPINADESLIKILLRNLVSNAIKYSADQDKPVIIKASKSSGIIEITIQDFGIGIPETSLKQVFEPFYRVEESRSKNTGGYGLGLNIAKKVADAHSGTLDIKNNPYRGVLVTLRLPET